MARNPRSAAILPAWTMARHRPTVGWKPTLPGASRKNPGSTEEMMTPREFQRTVAVVPAGESPPLGGNEAPPVMPPENTSPETQAVG